MRPTTRRAAIATFVGASYLFMLSSYMDRGQGDHGSIISPVASVGATAEMQGQMIKFLQTEGTDLEIIYHPVVQ